MSVLGKFGKDVISGFRGIITARTEHLYSVPQVCITPNRLSGEYPADGKWFEELRVVIESDAPSQPGHFI